VHHRHRQRPSENDIRHAGEHLQGQKYEERDGRAAEMGRARGCAPQVRGKPGDGNGDNQCEYAMDPVDGH